MVLQHMEIHAELQQLLLARNLAASVPVPARILQLWDYEQKQDPQVSPVASIMSSRAGLCQCCCCCCC